MNIVMVNGEKQCGKTTFCKQVEYLLFESPTDRIGFRYSLVTPIEQYLRMLWSQAPENKQDGYYTTEALKHTKIYGRLGRDWMIAFGNAMRTVNENILVELMFAQVRFIEGLHSAETPLDPTQSTLLIENWGFPGELVYTRALLRPGDRLITVHLNARASRRYNDGEQFDSDNRFSLGHMAQLINPTPSYVANLVDPDGGHPSHNQPITVETDTNWVPPLV